MPNGAEQQRVFHLPHWKYPARLPGLTGLYLNSVFRTLALGLIGIFIPVFVFQITSGWSGVLKFYLISETTTLILSSPTAMLIKKWGPDWLVGLGALTLITALGFLILSQNNLVFIWWAALFLGITVPFHWLPYHLAFCQESQRHCLHRQLANRNILNKISTAAAPLLGGIIAAKLGFTSLYLIAGIVIALSLIPILMDQYNQKGRALSWERVKKTLRKPNLHSTWLGFFGWGIESAIYAIFLPIYFFQSLTNLEEMGSLFTLSLLISLLAIAFIGKKSADNEGKVFGLGMIGSFPFWLIVANFSSFLGLASANAFYNITSQAIWIPVEGVVYRQGKKEGKSYFVLRNTFLRLGIISALLMGGVLKLFNFGWNYVFFGGVIGLLIVTNLSKGFKKCRA
ncbi:MAG: MFS transporter [Candidatus Shapirobacteria bacterium]